jgi:hypothetical protein
MRVYYDNKITSSTLLSVSSENSNYPKRNLYSIHLSSAFRFTSKTSQNIVIDFGSAISIDAFCMSSNLTSSATVNVEFNSSNSWGAPAATKSITPGYRIITETFSSVSYRYARITISDATNTDDLSIGNIYLGQELLMPSFNSNYNISPTSTSVATDSVSGQVYGKKGYFFKPHTFTFPQFNQTKKEQLDSFVEFCDNILPFYMAISYNNRTEILPEYCRMTDILKSDKTERGLFYNGSMSTRESF